MELTILMPCLNEAETLAVCIRTAKHFLSENNINGEVLISDNGSTDGSPEIAVSEGARVVVTDIKGYGSALINGTKEAYGEYVIMGDADDSYDFLHLMPFVEKLREGYDLVMGNRFAGGIESDAMPFSHRYIGNPVLSLIGRLFFKSNVRDFHCGLRGFNKKSILGLDLQTTGMEYASEMVVKSELNKLRVTEVPTTLKKDGRKRPPHLRSFQDGWRHLKLLLMYAPKWLFLFPGTLFLLLGVFFGAKLIINEIIINKVGYSVHTLLYGACAIAIGLSILQAYLIITVYAYNHGFFPNGSIDWNSRTIEDRIILGGSVLTLIGILLSIIAVKGAIWIKLNPEHAMCIIVSSALFSLVGIQLINTGFAVGMMKIRTGNK